MRLFTGLVRPRVTVLGNEFAGVIAAIGRSVTTFAIGDRVFGYCEGRYGAHAEYLTVPAGGSIAAMPENLTFEEAAPATEGAHYALSLLDGARVRRGHDVLVHGATGAIGSAAVQLARCRGAAVTATCATENLHLVERLGAQRVIDHTVEDFTADGEAYDVVLDAVGKSSFGRCRRLLKGNGTYLSTDLGPLSQNLVLALVTPLFGRRKVKFPVPRHDQRLVRQLKGLIEAGDFTPVIDRRYPLEQIVDAYRYVETGQKVGSVVITVGPTS
jgi:NADPH:quinone reductase-like Zn-dependent oxidoreductase